MIKNGHFQEKSFSLVPVFRTAFSYGKEGLKWVIAANFLPSASIFSQFCIKDKEQNNLS